MVEEQHILVPVAALRWIAGDDTGVSSKMIWAHMLNVTCKPPWWRYPSDPADLGRCLRLLELVPEWKQRIKEMAEHGPTWAALVAHWDELEQSMRDEVGIAWEKGDKAPRTYAHMRRILKDA